MISFIIPAYNAANTIKRSIDSIINQTEKIEYEIIIVDDGSTDNTSDIVAEYKGYEQIKYFEKENGGLSSARNYGFKKSNGEYIVFIDGDDYISKTLVEDIKPYIEKGYDLIKWNVYIVNESLNIAEDIKYKETKIYESGEDAFNSSFGEDHLLVCTWRYAIKRENVIEFPEGRFHEDFATTPIVMINSKNVVEIDKKEYYYVQTDESIMRSSDKMKKRKKIEDILINFDNLIKQINKLNISKITKDNVGIFGVNSLLVILPELEKDDKDYFINELKKRNISNYIKVKNPKQFLKKMYLKLKY